MTDKKLNKECAVALGNFDGLHIGHKKVLQSTLAYSKKHNLEAKVMLFDIHPREYIYKEKLPRLMSDKDTEKELSSMGFTVCRVSFAEMKDYSCEDFCKKILSDKFSAKAAFCGFNYSFGRNGAGDAETLKKLCGRIGIECFYEEPVSVDGMTVSSTAIRKYLADGEPEKAAEMLGRPYRICGSVLHGDKRGRTLGFPTANQQIDTSLAVPKYGVYETCIEIDGRAYKGVTNIGIRPTYIAECALSETYIIDFSGDIYGRNIAVELIRYIRPEKRFGSGEELRSQLIKDTAEVIKNV